MSPRLSATLPNETRLGPYEIVRLLGNGATASVYECRHVALGRRVAVKVQHPHLAQNKIAAARFLREGRALSRIAHPNVVEVFDVGESDEVPYLVMSLIDGEDLGDYLRRLHPLSLDALVDCMLAVISAVAAAHDAGIVHRDLKPSNVRVARDHRGRLVPCVLDFGISKLMHGIDEAELTDSEGVMGTVAYMSPEQLRSAKRVDERSDVYGLGVMLFLSATGRRPFANSNTYDLMHAILTEPPAPPSTLRRDLPPAFDAIVLRAMERKPSDRFASARELGRALAPFASEPGAWVGEFLGGSTNGAVPPR